MDKFIIFTTVEGERITEKFGSVQLGIKSTYLRVNGRMVLMATLSRSETFGSIISFLNDKTYFVLDISE